MSSLIQPKAYKQPLTYSVHCDECQDDPHNEPANADYIIGALKLCDRHITQLMRNLQQYLS